MKRINKGAGIAGFFRRKYCHRLIYLLLLAVPAVFEYYSSDFVKRTFVFYARDTDEAEVEERILPAMPTQELALRQYVEETLLGPISPEAEPLFPRETVLRSLIYQDGIVYADLSLAAALPYSPGTEAFRSLRILHQGIRRDFGFVRDVRLFIEGKEAYYERFRGLSVFHTNSRMCSAGIILQKKN
ncbi:MAG: GerMN domain-containing protein [Treponema sp.]|jgi:hypothetical protein|nr:GerMN domain-containing protein [Treponema sp.]